MLTDRQPWKVHKGFAVIYGWVNIMAFSLIIIVITMRYNLKGQISVHITLSYKIQFCSWSVKVVHTISLSLFVWLLLLPLYNKYDTQT